MEVVSIVKMILFTVAFWLFLIVIGFHTPAKRTKKIIELLMGGMILFFFLFEILALCAVFFRWKFLAGCIPCIILTGIYLLLRVEGMG